MPQIGFVSAPQDATTLSGENVPATAADLTVAHHLQRAAAPRAAAHGIAVHRGRRGHRRHHPAPVRAAGKHGTLRLAMPSGVLTVGGEVVREAGAWRAVRGSFYRTTRRLFEGYVYA